MKKSMMNKDDLARLRKECYLLAVEYRPDLRGDPKTAEGAEQYFQFCTKEGEQHAFARLDLLQQLVAYNPPSLLTEAEAVLEFMYRVPDTNAAGAA